MSARVVVVGPASWNTLVRLDRLPEPRPHAVVARGTVRTLGGTSAGKALHLADLGVDVTLSTTVGDDDEGALVLAALAHPRVELLADRRPGPTEQHLNLMTDAGERVTVYLATVAPADGGPDAVLLDRLAAADDVVLDLSPSTLPVLAAARATGARTWVDLHDDDGRDAFRDPFRAVADHVFCNDDALDDPLPYLHARVEAGARVAVCTLGAAGAVAVDAAHVEHRVPAAPVERVVDTNGAGDGFMAGYLAATLTGADVPAALAAGARQAARALGTVHLSPLLDGRV